MGSLEVPAGVIWVVVGSNENFYKVWSFSAVSHYPALVGLHGPDRHDGGEGRSRDCWP